MKDIIIIYKLLSEMSNNNICCIFAILRNYNDIILIRINNVLNNYRFVLVSTKCLNVNYRDYIIKWK